VSFVTLPIHVTLLNNPSVLKEIPQAAKIGVNSFKMFLGYKKRGMMVSTDFC